jgi:glycosyltransferase involved in cell wall biosynthesis
MQVRLGILRHELAAAVRRRRVWRAVRAIASFAFPSRWSSSPRTRSTVLDAGVHAGSRAAAASALAELARDPDSRKPGSAAARRRSSALEVLAAELPPGRRRIEQTLASYLRGDLAPPPSTASQRTGTPADEAAAAAHDLRAAGRADPVIVATFPGFSPNPYGALMEQSYRPAGLAPIHVTSGAAVDEILLGQDAGGYRTVIHLNAPDRFVGRVPSAPEAAATIAASLRTLDGWLGQGATIIASVHNGPRLAGHRAIAERGIAQGIMDRARLIHVLTRSTPRLLADWISIDPQRTIHVPHPSYDGVYGALPARAAARSRLAITTEEPEPVVVGLIGSLANRKGVLDLLDSLDAVPDPLPGGRPLRVLLAGTPIGSHAEDLIRRALAEPRVVARIGYVPDEELPWLLAALDVAVIPYGQLLNSGWLHLALTAGIPAIAPSGGTAEEIVQREALRTYRAGDREGLASALRGAEALLSPVARAAARRSVEGLNARGLSEQLAAAIARVVEGGFPVQAAASGRAGH